jgi:hypothetical protein
MGGQFSTDKNFDRERGFLKRTIALWDLSKLPATNDRLAKLGFGDLTPFGAIVEFDEATQIAKPADPTVVDGMVLGMRYPEPDNWMLRLHDEKGEGNDGVWAHRLIADHTNAATSRTNRSTFVIDQCEHQRQGSLQDVLWGCDIETDAGDDELIIGPAGFLALMDKSLSGAMEGIRLALAFNIAKNAGFMTDGRYVAQLWHVLHIGIPGQVGQTSTEDPPCQPNEKAVGGLRGDVPFVVGEDFCHLGISDFTTSDEECGQPFIGRLFKYNTKSAMGPAGDLREDKKSNHAPLSRKDDKGLWLYVKIPKERLLPETTTPPGAGGTPTPTAEVSGTTPQPTVAAFPSADLLSTAWKFKQADGYQVWPLHVPINYDLKAGSFMELGFQVRPTAAYGGGQASNLVLMYKALGPSEDESTVAWTEDTKALDNSLTLLSTAAWNELRFRIPNEKLIGREGGHVTAYLFYLSTSTGPDLLVA